jgi:lipopolysaccharide exporter
MALTEKFVPKIVDILKGDNLKARCARGSIVLGIGAVAGRGSRFIRNMILARLLAPKDFGLMAIIMVVVTTFDMVTEVGVKQSVIQNKRGAEPDYLNVTWWFQLVRGLGLFFIAILAAPLISFFYEKPELLRLLQVAFLAILFRGLVSPQSYVLEKTFKFGKSVSLTQGSAVLGTLITVILAFMVRNVWAIIIGFVAESAILCLMSYIMVPFMPRFKIDKECLKELMKFARDMFGLPIMVLISCQADVLVLGKTVTGEQLGMYYLAMSLSYQLIDLFCRIISPVLLPAFAQKQDDKESLCRAIIDVTRESATFSIPAILLMTSCANGILLLAYGQKYTVVVVPFGILCMSILLHVPKNILGMMYLAIGKPQLQRRYAIILCTIIVTTIYPAIKLFGLTGAASVLLFANLITYCVQVFEAQHQIGLRFRPYASSWLPGIYISIVPLLAVGILQLAGIKSPIVRIIAGATGLFAAFLFYFILRFFHKNTKVNPSKLSTIC